MPCSRCLMPKLKLQNTSDTRLISDYYVGKKYGEIWGYTTVGIAKTQEEMDAHLPLYQMVGRMR